MTELTEVSRGFALHWWRNQKDETGSAQKAKDQHHHQRTHVTHKVERDHWTVLTGSIIKPIKLRISWANEAKEVKEHNSDTDKPIDNWKVRFTHSP